MCSAHETEDFEALCAHDMKLLETGEFSDFTVICGDQTWKAHKIILCRVDYFEKIITNGFKESQENQINIQSFEPFEINLLLQYIYHPKIDAEDASLQIPSHSFLETCVRLWQLGDYYRMEALATTAFDQLKGRLQRYHQQSGHLVEMLKGLPFLFDLECGIRAAWDPEKAAGPHRTWLALFCQSIGHYLRKYPTIITLFDVFPEFASEFSKAVIGCFLDHSGKFQGPYERECDGCHALVQVDHEDMWEPGTNQVIYHPSGSLAVLDGVVDDVCCSRECLEKVISPELVHPDCEICEELGAQED